MNQGFVQFGRVGGGLGYVVTCKTRRYGLRVFTKPDAGRDLAEALVDFEARRRRCPIVGTFTQDCSFRGRSA